MKLKSLTKGTENQTTTLPLVGDVYFNEENIVEIEDNMVDELLKLEFGIKFEKLSNKKEDKINKVIDVQVLDEQPKTSVRESLEVLSTKELKELLKQFDESEVKDLKKKDQIIEFLITKL